MLIFITIIKLRDDGLYAVRKPPRHPKPQGFFTPVQPSVGTSQEYCSSNWHGRDCLDCGNKFVRTRFTACLSDESYTWDVLGPSIRLWLGNSLRGRNSEADCENISKGKCQPLLSCLLDPDAVNYSQLLPKWLGETFGICNHATRLLVYYIGISVNAVGREYCQHYIEMIQHQRMRA
jgi:hypothetical protein